MNISIENNKRNLKTYTKSNIQYYEISGRVLYGSFERYQMQTGEIDKNNYDLLVDIVDQQNKYYKTKDFKNFYKISCFGNIIDAHSTVGSNSTNPFIKKILDKKSLEIWDEVSDGIKYEDINFQKGTSGVEHEFSQFIMHMLNLKYNYYMYENNIGYYSNEDYNNMGFTYRFLITMIPILIIIIGILTNYDNINKEVNEGSTKLILTQSTSRWKYYLSKYFSGVIIVLFIIIVPMVIINIILGIKYGFQPANFPVFYDKQGLTRFLPAFNYLEKYKEFYGYEYRWGISSTPLVPLGAGDGIIMIQRNINIIPYYQFILLSIIYLILFTLFLVAFVQLFSTLINNQIISIAAILGIYGGMYFLGKGFLTERHYNVNPFTMHNSARIVAGTHNVTMLTAAIILISSTILFLAIGLKYFKVKEI
jgi:ABC-type transport system involved in multi-copper enzyme maturation permease subunit